MKKNFLTKAVSLGLAAVLSIGILAGCGGTNSNTPVGSEGGSGADSPVASGTTMSISNLASCMRLRRLLQRITVQSLATSLQSFTVMDSTIHRVTLQQLRMV